MSGTRLQMQCQTKDGTEARDVTVAELVIAGWAGRDAAAMEAHIAELAAIGVPRPAETPTFYRVAASLLTTDKAIQVAGGASSGEAETVLFALDDGPWVGLGSDHTDREAETHGITLAKQMCAKPVAPALWRFADVAAHWDRLVLRSHAVEGGQRRLYQEGEVAGLLRPEALVERLTGGKVLPVGWAMFGGTMPVIGEIAPADSFELELEDPVLDRRIIHRYEVQALPVAG